jgi:hypothetical protein
MGGAATGAALADTAAATNPKTLAKAMAAMRIGRSCFRHGRHAERLHRQRNSTEPSADRAGRTVLRFAQD